jgi:hypothetical protein
MLFSELESLKPVVGTKWLALVNFNQIYHARDKKQQQHK